MRHVQLQLRDDWHVLGGTPSSQAAEMVIPPGEHEGGPDNRHRESDQWLYVVAGTGTATVRGEQIELRPGSLLLVERGEEHDIENTGDEPLKTLNFYSPPAY